MEMTRGLKVPDHFAREFGTGGKFKLSQITRMGIAYRFQEGKVMVNHNRFLGYTKDENGELVIVPEEAEIIKRIYREFMEGKSDLKIAKGLEHDGILTGAGKATWWSSTVKTILKNEKYMGDAEGFRAGFFFTGYEQGEGNKP